MLRALGGIATISGLLVVLAYKITLPYIEENQRRATETAVFEILPQAKQQLGFVITDNGLVPVKPGVTGETIYAGYDATGKLQGVALNGAGQGYGDLIRILYAYRPACACITSVKILKMAETPGIGDQIVTNAKFLQNFTALDVTLNKTGNALANPIIAVKQGTKTNPWQIDAISGATISSRGLATGLNSSAQRLIPIIHKQLDQLTSAIKK
jgi:electron transport complex protein RnfG